MFRVSDCARVCWRLPFYGDTSWSGRYLHPGTVACRDIYYEKFYEKGGGMASLGKKKKKKELGKKNEKGKEKRRKITLKKEEKALKMHHFGL